jgi:iron complex outermembrane receptor protein
MTAMLTVTGRLSAQDYIVEDTISISAVTVTASAAVRLTPYTVDRIEQEVITMHQGGDLASLLQAASTMYVKRYGNTGLSTVSVRGLSGSHTLVTWNGLPLNAPGNGYSDFTIIPVMAVSTVKITSGGADLDDISGYIGGKVEVGSSPVFGAGKEVTAGTAAGSFGELRSHALLRYSRTGSFFRLGAWTGKANNDFRFIITDAPGGPQADRRANSSFSDHGIIGEMAFSLKNGEIRTDLWYNDSDRELPGPVTTVQQDFGERQTDRSFRGVMNYSADNGPLRYELVAGGTHDLNRYFNVNPDNNGINSSSMVMLRLRLGYRLSDKTGLVLNAGDTYEKAQALSFDGEQQRDIFSVSLAAKSAPLPRLNILIQVRQMVVTAMKVSPEFTAGASWLLSANGEHLLKVNFSHNKKLPCFNDLYWMPGGNPDLVAEQSTGGETSWSFSRQGSEGSRTTVDLILHAAKTDDMIQWIPGQSGIWHAVNLRSVNLSGAEIRAGRQLTAGQLKVAGYMNYAFSRSVIARSEIPNDRSVGKQLIYAPLHHSNINISASWRWLIASMTQAWESRRYTTSDNSEWLPSSFITDASVGAVIPAGKVSVKTELKINNILNTSSESVRNYPMPLRTINLNLNLTWSEKTNENEKDL